ncbi:MAG: hypothetical protein ABJC04_05050 [Verrucomicrobiota bacterium]
MIVETDTKQIAEVQRTVQSIYTGIFPAGDPAFVPRVFGWTNDCFTGQYPGYQPIDARYHDLEHTLQVTLCMMRLLQGRHVHGDTPALSDRMFQLGLLAILLHDTGYLKRRSDVQGTGAKYTLIHVDRSIEFAAELLGEKGFSASEIKSVQNMIRCTGVKVNLETIPFQSEAERLMGFALGTGDLVGQMAAPDYIDKLPILYSEFAEAFHFNEGKLDEEEMFHSAEDLIQKTPAFWETFAKPKIEKDFLGLYRFLNESPGGENRYLQRIEKNIARLKQTLKAA